MLAALCRFTTNALAIHATNILAGYSSEKGNALPVTIARAYSPDPASVPEVWLESRPADDVAPNLIGDHLGFDASGNRWYALLHDGIRCDIGVRSRMPVERDNLFDLLTASLLLAVNPASGRQWKEELWTTSGLLVQGIGGTRFAQTPSSAFGPLYEALATIQLYGELAVSVTTSPVLSIVVAPTATLVITF